MGEILCDRSDYLRYRSGSAAQFAKAPESIQEIVPEPNRIPLLKVRDVPYGAEYSIDYRLFSEAGEYRIVLYAQDSSGLISRPKEIRLQTGWSIYLPALSNE